jgi:hypothetical protein
LNNSGVTFCAAKQGYREHASLGINSEASVLTHGSEAVSKPVSYDSVAESETKTAAPELTPEEEALLQEIAPVRFRDKDGSHKCDLAFILNFANLQGFDALELLRYNREHKKGGLRIRTVSDYVRDMLGDAEGKFTLVNEYLVWRDKTKPKDKPKTSNWNTPTEDRVDGVTYKPTNGAFSHEDPEDDPIAVGKFFDVEEA